MRRLLLGMALLPCAALYNGPAHADARPPRYDTEALCSRLANTPDGFSEESRAHCLVDQDDALDTIQHVWQEIPPYIQDDCDVRARIGGEPDYHTLQSCIRTQMRQQEPDAVVPGVAAPPPPPPAD